MTTTKELAKIVAEMRASEWGFAAEWADRLEALSTDAQPVYYIGNDGRLARYPATPEPDAAGDTPVGSYKSVDGLQEIYRKATPQSAAREPGGEDAALRVAVDALVGIVERAEGRGRRWAANGERLKDTPEWVAFYNAALRTRTPAPAVIDDAMVQRAEEAFWPAYLEAKRTHGKQCHATGMRAAIAALAPEQGNNDG
jgi:hypothetical protein